MNIGEKIRLCRNEKRISQRKLAKESGVSFAYIQQLEKGEKTNPSMDILNKIASALGISVLEFLPQPDFKKSIAELDKKIELVGNEPEKLNSIRATSPGSRNQTIKLIEDTNNALSEYINLKAGEHGIRLGEAQVNDIILKVCDLIDYELYKIEKNKDA